MVVKRLRVKHYLNSFVSTYRVYCDTEFNGNVPVVIHSNSLSSESCNFVNKLFVADFHSPNGVFIHQMGQ